MKNLSKLAKSILLVSLFALSSTLIGCSADSLTGVQDEEPPQVQTNCEGSDCSNGHNL